MVLDGTNEPPQRRPMDVRCHNLETTRQEKTDKGDQPSGGETTWKKHWRDIICHGTACWYIRPCTRYWACPMMIIMMMTFLLIRLIILYGQGSQKLYNWLKILSPPHYRNGVHHRLKLYVYIVENSDTFQKIYSFMQFK